MIRILTGNLLLLCLFVSSETMAAVSASVDRNRASEFDFVTLTIRATDDDRKAEPDFSAIERDFDILQNSSQESTSLTIVQGRTTRIAYKDHVLTLKPKRLGTLTIPAIQVGNRRTQPIRIRVEELSPAMREQMTRLVFFETEVDTNETYVQGQIIYSVRLFYSDAIGGDFPQPPLLEDAVVETIENEKRYESIVNDKRFYVLEKRYAIFPQRSGELVIPQERFSGTRGRGGLFSQRQRVFAVSDSHTVNVKTIPQTFSGDNWIPAKALGIKESWAESPSTFRVGEPINRKLLISAIGLSDSLLPPFADMPVENAKIYADPPVTEKRLGADGITALQETTIGVVPTKEGELTLPEIRLPWWNTQTDREEIAIIPAATYQVLPATGETAQAPTVTVPISELPAPTVIQETTSRYWQIAAVALGLLWLMSSWQWLVLRRQVAALKSAEATRYVARFEDPDEARLYRELKDACKAHRAGDAHRQLFLWAKARYENLYSLNDLTRYHEALAAELDALEAVLFGQGQPGEWKGNNLLKLVNELRTRKEARSAKHMLEQELNPA